MRLVDGDALTLMDVHLIDGKFLCDAPRINAIPIPENATNGDMIKAMFTCLVVIERAHFVHVYLSDRDFWMAEMWANFDLDWWNAPYKGGSNETDNN